MTGAELKKMRKKIGISQEGLAALTGVRQNLISQIELGRSTDKSAMARIEAELLELDAKRVANSKDGGLQEYVDERLYQAFRWAISMLSSQMYERAKHMNVEQEEKQLDLIVDFVAKIEEARGQTNE